MDRWASLSFGPLWFQRVATWLMSAWGLATLADVFVNRPWLTVVWWILSIVMIPSILVGVAAPWVYRFAARRVSDLH